MAGTGLGCLLGRDPHEKQQILGEGCVSAGWLAGDGGGYLLHEPPLWHAPCVKGSEVAQVLLTMLSTFQRRLCGRHWTAVMWCWKIFCFVVLHHVGIWSCADGNIYVFEKLTNRK